MFETLQVTRSERKQKDRIGRPILYLKPCVPIER
jgi:hypothetical protein